MKKSFITSGPDFKKFNLFSALWKLPSFELVNERFGHTAYLQNVSGILSMSPFDEDVPVTHYIAPFYGAFDLTIAGTKSAIYFESRGKFIVH